MRGHTAPMILMPLLVALTALSATSQASHKHDDDEVRRAPAHVAPPPRGTSGTTTHQAVPVTQPPRALPARSGSAPVRPPPPPSGPSEPDDTASQTPEPPRHHHHGSAFYGSWVSGRVSEGVAEVRTEGPGPIRPVADPDPVDREVVGNWRVVLPVVTAVSRGYGRVNTVQTLQDLGGLNINLNGGYDWTVPGRMRSSGTLTEVTGQNAGEDVHFWSFEGNGRTLVIAPGGDGSLILYDAGNNSFYARAQR